MRRACCTLIKFKMKFNNVIEIVHALACYKLIMPLGTNGDYLSIFTIILFFFQKMVKLKPEMY